MDFFVVLGVIVTVIILAFDGDRRLKRAKRVLTEISLELAAHRDGDAAASDLALRVARSSSALDTVELDAVAAIEAAYLAIEQDAPDRLDRIGQAQDAIVKAQETLGKYSFG